MVNETYFETPELVDKPYSFFKSKKRKEAEAKLKAQAMDQAKEVFNSGLHGRPLFSEAALKSPAKPVIIEEDLKLRPVEPAKIPGPLPGKQWSDEPTGELAKEKTLEEVIIRSTKKREDNATSTLYKSLLIGGGILAVIFIVYLIVRNK